MTDVAGVHDDELLGEISGRATSDCRLSCGASRVGVDPVRDHAQAVRRRALLLQPPAHGVADRDDPVRATQVEADETAQQAHHRRILESLELDGDLGEDVLADDDERHPEAAGDEERDVRDDRRVGHAENDVRPRPAHDRASSAFVR